MLKFSAGQSNCITHIPEDIKIEASPSGVNAVGTTMNFNNGVVSNFSLGNYLKIDKKFNFTNKPWEMVTKYSFKEFNTNIRLLGSLNKVALFVLGFTDDTGVLTFWASSNGTSWDISNAKKANKALNLNTNYYIKISWNGYVYTIDYKTENGNYENLITINSSLQILDDNEFCFGTNYSNTQYFSGNLDLRGCYIKIDNKIVWQGGSGQVTLKKGSKLWYPDGLDYNGNKKFNYIITDKDYISGHSLTNSWRGYLWLSINKVNWNIGAGGFSGISTTEKVGKFYNLKNNKIYDLQNSVQYCFPIAYVKSDKYAISSIENIFNGFGYIGKEAFILPGVKGCIPNGLNDDGSNKNIYTETTTVRTHTITINNSLTLGIDLASQGTMTYNSKQNLMYKELNPAQVRYEIPIADVMLNTEKTLITSMKQYKVSNNYEYKNIDSIKYNVGKSNCITEIPQDIKLDFNDMNVEFIGNDCQISNGKISGFSTTSRLDIHGSKLLNADQLKSLEIKLKINSGEILTTNGRIMNAYGNTGDSLLGFFIQITTSNIIIAYYDGKTYLTCSAINNPQKNTDYYVKWVYDGQTLKGYYSTDDGIYNLTSTVTPSYKLYLNTLDYGIGNRPRDMSAVCVFNGSIYLNDCYIKANDEIWWKGGDGSITLKAGSIIYKPNGIDENSNKIFNKIVTSDDIKLKFGWGTINELMTLFYREDINRLERTATSRLSSKDEPSGTYTFYYDTNENLIKEYTKDNGYTNVNVSLPICTFIAVGDNSPNAKKIVNIFNGFGYIGATQFVLPGVRYVIPNGCNEDGTNRNIYKEIKTVSIYNDTVDIQNTWNKIMLLDELGNYVAANTYYNQVEKPSFNENSNQIWYNPNNNKTLYYRNSSLSEYRKYTKINDYTITNGKITSWTYPAITTKDTILNLKDVYYGVGKSNCLTYIPNDIKLKTDPLYIVKTGGVSIENGIAKNFAPTNYITMPNNLTLGNNYEILMKFNFKEHEDSDTSQYQLLMRATTDKFFAMAVNYLNGSYYLHTNSGDGANWLHGENGTKTLTPNTDYYVKVIKDANNRNIYISTNNIDYELYYTIEDTTNLKSLNYIIGVSIAGEPGIAGSQPFKGEIDLKPMYIKSNNEILWKGASGNITLLKGSKVYFADGSYDIIENDVIHTTYFNNESSQLLFCYHRTEKWIGGSALSNCYANTTTPETPIDYMYWLDKTNKKVKRYYSSSNIWKEEFSLPLFISKSCISIDQIFNGFGFIGGMYFMLPGIKYSIPNGFNSDGTYNTINATVDKVSISALNTGANITNRAICISKRNDTQLADWMTNYYEIDNKVSDNSGWFYVKSENKIFNRITSTNTWSEDLTRCHAGQYVIVNNKITSLKVDSIKKVNDVIKIK